MEQGSDHPLQAVWRDMLSQDHRIIPVGELRSLLDRHGLPDPEELAEMDDMVGDWMPWERRPCGSPIRAREGYPFAS